MATDDLTSNPPGVTSTSSTLCEQLHESGTRRSEHDDNDSTFSKPPGLGSSSRIWKGKTPSRSFGSSLFQSLKRPSRSLTVEPSRRSQGSYRSPLVVFQDLLDLLLSKNVPGPSLYRTRTEYTDRLGSGRTFEVLGAGPTLLEHVAELAEHNESLFETAQTEENISAVLRALERFPLVAIKRAYVDGQQTASQDSHSSTESQTRAFGHRLICVEREIRNLCHPELREHPNIIKILGWGLCLDTLEDITAPEPRIPLLVLERAHCTLGQLIATKELSCQFGCVQRHKSHLGILQNIGSGLEAIHGAGLIHGDIKLENVLIFKQKGGLVAKLSDFGLTIAGSGYDATSAVSNYRGTPRWCPLPGSARYLCKDLYPFDHLTYGLVAWCIFADLCHSPLPSDERPMSSDVFEASTLFDICVTQLTHKHTEIALPLRLCLRACLSDDPMHWRRFPWKSLENVTYWEANSYRFGFETVPRIFRNRSWGFRCQMGIPSRETNTMSILRSCGGIFESASERFRSLPELCYKVRNLLPVRTEIQNFRRITLSQRGKTVKAVIQHVKIEAPSFRGSRQSQFLSHPDGFECWSFRELAKQIQICAKRYTTRPTKKQTDRLYALLRVRSRLPVCCMKKTGHFLNCVEFALQNNANFETLAWACHGEMGRVELHELDVQVLAIWLAELETLADHSTASEIIARLVLLVEKGCRIEDAVHDPKGVKSVFWVMLELSYRCQNDATFKPFMECIVRLQTQAMDQSISASMRPSLRYFLTGHGLPDHLGDLPDHETIGWTTALHESVKISSYSMVEALVLNGFHVNAFDAKGKIAYYYSGPQFSQIRSEVRDDDTEIYEADRIVALLGQNTDSSWSPQAWHQDQSKADTLLPIGWNYVSFTEATGKNHTFLDNQQDDQDRLSSFRRKVPFVSPMYLDRHFGSVTLKSPTFSYFTDQRLALGFRRVHLPGQTYYLDLLRFLQPPSSLSSPPKISEPTYSLAYYEREAWDSDTQRTLSFKSSVNALYSRVQVIATARKAALMSADLTVRIDLEHTAASLHSVIARIAHHLMLLSSPPSALLKALFVPEQPINIYMGSIPAAFLAHKFAWSFKIELLVNLVALASLCSITQTAHAVTSGRNRDRLAPSNLAIVYFGFFVDLLGLSYLEVSCLVLFFRHNLAGAVIPFMLAAFSWNFHLSVIGYIYSLIWHEDIALNAFIFPFVSLILLEGDRVPNATSIFMAQILPFILAHNFIFTIAVLILLSVYHRRTSDDQWISSRKLGLILAPHAWLWDKVIETLFRDTREYLGGFQADRQPRSVWYVLSALSALSFAISAAVFICSNIIGLVAENNDQALRGLILHVLIPLTVRFDYLRIQILAFLRSDWPPAPDDQYRWIASLSSGKLLYNRFYAPASHTFVLWVLVYPVMSFVRLAQKQPLSIHIPDLDVTRTILVCLALPSATYMSIVKDGDKRVRYIFCLCSVSYLLHQSYLLYWSGRT